MLCIDLGCNSQGNGVTVTLLQREKKRQESAPGAVLDRMDDRVLGLGFWGFGV